MTDRPTHGYCPECKEDSAIDFERRCLWCGTATRQGRGGGKPKGVYGKLEDRHLRALHVFHIDKGVSIRELGRRIWRQAGFASAHSADVAIGEGFKRLGLPALSRSEATAAANRNRAKERGLPFCAFIKADGSRCGRRTSKGRCWHHREEGLRRRLDELHARDSAGEQLMSHLQASKAEEVGA